MQVKVKTSSAVGVTFSRGHGQERLVECRFRESGMMTM
jgi:hypothetical protein